MFETKQYKGKEYLHLIKGYKGAIRLPNGCTDCSMMFEDSDLTDCYFEDFDTSKVACMDYMFFRCKMPQRLDFDTSSVTSMRAMFDSCVMPDGFSLGDSFDTSNVLDMSYMFSRCRLSKGFSLGSKFSLVNALSTREMFARCHFSDDFFLREDFCIENIPDTFMMFKNGMYGDMHLYNSDEAVIAFLKTKRSYNFRNLLDVAPSLQRNCQSLGAFREIINKYC